MKRVPAFPEALDVQRLADWYQAEVVITHNVSSFHQMTVSTVDETIRNKDMTDADKVEAIRKLLDDRRKMSTWWYQRALEHSRTQPHVTLYRLETE